MVEYINDPCDLIDEEVEEVRPEGPQIIPVTPQRIEVPPAAFPVREGTAIEQSTIRESALIDTYSLNQAYVKNRIRLPEEALSISEWSGDRFLIDTFRFAAGKNYNFNNGRLSFIYSGVKQSSESGVPFEIKLNSRMMGDTETAEVVLIFDKVLMTKLLQNRNINTPIDKFIYGYISGDPEFSNSNVPLIANTNKGLYDSSFIAPAAFYQSEAEQASVPLIEVVSVKSAVGNFPLTVLEEQEVSKTSLYRLHSSIVNPNINQRITGDRIQKFDSRAVSRISEITEQATNGIAQSQLYSDAEKILNTHIRIQMNMNHESEICRIMKSGRLDSVFMDFLVQGSSVMEEKFVQVLDQSRLGGAENNRLVFNYEPVVRNAETFFDSIFQETARTIRFMDSVKHQHPIPYYEESPSELRSTIEQGYFSGIPEMALNDFVQQNRRSIKQIMQGSQSYSEVVAYRIEKIRLGTGEVVQNFYFFNDQDTTFIDFIDTQVSYTRKYEYKIYTINAVIGNMLVYRTENEKYSPTSFIADNPIYEFKITNEMVFRLIESPYFSQQIAMIDKPPMFPQAEIIPFFQNPRKVGFRMTPTFGNIVEEPIYILEEDNMKIANMLETRGPNASEVEYSSDSQPTEYELLLLETVPYSYGDFSIAKKFSVKATYNSGYLELELEPNKRYYMLFRASDVSGISNPSAVYTVVLNQHTDGLYVEFDEFDLIPKILDEQMVFERILKIDPSPEQTAVNFGQLNTENNFYLSAPDVKLLTLGLEKQKVWANNYKFRLISRATGKAIDINVNYGFQIIEPPKEIEIVLPPEPEPVDEQILDTITNDLAQEQQSPVRTVENSLNIFSQERQLPGVQTRYDEQGRPVESRVQQSPYPTRFPGN